MRSTYHYLHLQYLCKQDALCCYLYLVQTESTAIYTVFLHIVQITSSPTICGTNINNTESFDLAQSANTPAMPCQSLRTHYQLHSNWHPPTSHWGIVAVSFAQSSNAQIFFRNGHSYSWLTCPLPSQVIKSHLFNNPVEFYIYPHYVTDSSCSTPVWARGGSLQISHGPIKHGLCPSCGLMCRDWEGLMSGLGNRGSRPCLMLVSCHPLP